MQGFKNKENGNDVVWKENIQQLVFQFWKI